MCPERERCVKKPAFVIALVAAVVAALLIGAFADFGPVLERARAVLGRDVDSAAPQGLRETSIRARPASRDDATRRLKFVIDTRGDTDSSDANRQTAALRDPTSCRLPTATNAAEVILFGIYEGDAVSSVALADRDSDTGVMEIIVEPGVTPLHLILSSYQSTIWRFSGAVDRVSRVVLMASPTSPPRDWSPPRPEYVSAGNAASTASAYARHAQARRSSPPPRPRPGRAVYAGVVGVPADRVRTVAPDACFEYFYEADSIKAVRIAATVQRAMGQRPDIVAGAYSLAAVKLPSGKGAPGSRRMDAPDGFDPRLWDEALRFSPAGLAAIQPAEVVSEVDALPYDVLPGQMGLAQLVAEGRLVRLSDGLKIVAPIPRFPARLTGAHSTSFLLGTGVPMPDGSPGHSCVVLESTGQPVGRNPLCR